MKLYCQIIKQLLLAVVLFASSAHALDSKPLLSAAKKLLNSGQAMQAFTLLDKAETELSNNFTFNYLHGLAALDSGQPGIAVLSLQRAVRQKPEFPGARLELARAYYATGNTQTAQREFEQLLLLNPPENVVRVIERYLDAGQRSRQQYAASAGARLAATAGYDSNANAGLDSSTVPGLLLLGQPVELPERSRETSSAFTGASLKFHGQLPLSPAWRITASADGDIKEFNNASQVNSNSYGLQTGLDYSLQSLVITTQLSANRHAISDEIDYSNSRAAVAMLLQPSPQWLLRSSVGYGRLRFSDNLDNRDVDQRDITLGAQRFFDRAWITSGVVTALAGRDLRPDNRNSASEDWSRRILGGQLIANSDLSPKWQLISRFTGLISRYDEAFSFRSDSREDLISIYSLSFKRRRLLCKQCSLRLELSHLNQTSNDPRFDYDSSNIAISMERSF